MFYRLIFILLLWTLEVWAYIPQPEMVLSRLERNQGRGWYHVTQKVYFLETSRFTESFQLIENWYKGPDQAYVHITSPEYPQLKIYFLYNNKFKKWKNSHQKTITHQGYYIESYFFQKPPTWLDQISALKLGRALGVVNYVFSQGDRILWVEQDEFIPRKIRFSPLIVLDVHDYHSFSRGLWFPKRRVFHSPDYKVNFEYLSIRPLPKKPPWSLKANDWETSIPNRDIDLLRKFYQKFR